MLRRPLQPPRKISAALQTRRLRIQSAFNESLEHAVILTDQMNRQPRSHEVATLSHFFLNVPALQTVLRILLKPLRVSVKGVFGHHSQPYGPVVDFDGPPGCELCDMLFLVTYGPTGKGQPFANASFFQAKLKRGSMFNGKSSKRQRQLYEQAKSFVFRKPSVYASKLTEPTTPGWREMPGSSTSGFCFWSYNREILPDTVGGWGWPWHASAVTTPTDFDAPEKDEGFGEALFNLLTGNFGLAVSPPGNKDFGWNRIVHDFVLRAAREPLGHTYGVAHPTDIRRYPWKLDEVNALLRGGLTLVANPFGELFGWFASEDLVSLGKYYAEKQKWLSRDRLRALLSEYHREADDDGPGNNEPPSDDFEPGPDDAGGSGSFVHINISIE